MLITDKNIDIWYREYLKQYEKTKKYVTSRGGKVRDIKPSSRQDFKVDFLSSISDENKLSGTKIAQNLAKQELYETSWKQAEKYAKAHVEKFGGEVNLNLIQRYRMNAVRGQNIWNVIKERRRELKFDGLSTYSANMIIGQEFFGSE
jgi:hypothetical protein